LSSFPGILRIAKQNTPKLPRANVNPFAYTTPSGTRPSEREALGPTPSSGGSSTASEDLSWAPLQNDGLGVSTRQDVRPKTSQRIDPLREPLTRRGAIGIAAASVLSSFATKDATAAEEGDIRSTLVAGASGMSSTSSWRPNGNG
jgi:hypothetical protein